LLALFQPHLSIEKNDATQIKARREGGIEKREEWYSRRIGREGEEKKESRHLKNKNKELSKSDNCAKEREGDERKIS